MKTANQWFEGFPWLESSQEIVSVKKRNKLNLDRILFVLSFERLWPSTGFLSHQLEFSLRSEIFSSVDLISGMP